MMYCCLFCVLHLISFRDSIIFPSQVITKTLVCSIPIIQINSRWLVPGKTDAIVPAPKAPNQKVKQVPVCKCGLDKQNCETCSEGYLEIVLLGRPPHFKSIPVETKKVPICKCGLEKATCEVCTEGYMEVVTKGMVPYFKEVEVTQGWLCGKNITQLCYIICNLDVVK